MRLQRRQQLAYFCRRRVVFDQQTPAASIDRARLHGRAQGCRDQFFNGLKPFAGVPRERCQFCQRWRVLARLLQCDRVVAAVHGCCLAGLVKVRVHGIITDTRFARCRLPLWPVSGKNTQSSYGGARVTGRRPCLRCEAGRCFRIVRRFRAWLGGHPAPCWHGPTQFHRPLCLGPWQQAGKISGPESVAWCCGACNAGRWAHLKSIHLRGFGRLICSSEHVGRSCSHGHQLPYQTIRQPQ